MAVFADFIGHLARKTEIQQEEPQLQRRLLTDLDTTSHRDKLGIIGSE